MRHCSLKLACLASGLPRDGDVHMLDLETVEVEPARDLLLEKIFHSESLGGCSWWKAWQLDAERSGPSMSRVLKLKKRGWLPKYQMSCCCTAVINICSAVRGQLSEKAFRHMTQTRPDFNKAQMSTRAMPVCSIHLLEISPLGHKWVASASLASRRILLCRAARDAALGPV